MDPKVIGEAYNEVDKLLAEYIGTKSPEIRRGLMNEALKKSCVFLTRLDLSLMRRGEEFMIAKKLDKELDIKKFEEFLSSESMLLDRAGVSAGAANKLIGLLRDRHGKGLKQRREGLLEEIAALKTVVCDHYSDSVGAEAKLALHTRIFYGIGGGVLFTLNIAGRRVIGDVFAAWSLIYGSDLIGKAAENLPRRQFA